MASTAHRVSGLPATLAAMPAGVVRPADAVNVYAHPPAEFRRLAARGLLHRLATGYYVPVPTADRDRSWLPTLEAAAYGIAAADYGPDDAVLMGLSAARLHGAVPRALAVAVVAVPKQRPVLRLLDRVADVRFVRRDVARLDAERLPTELGTALATGIEQTVLDLAHRPRLGGVDAEARAAVASLWPRADPDVLDYLASQQRLRAALERARSLADGPRA